jgi:cell division transport system permease protein
MLSLRSAFRAFSRAPLLSLLSITTIAFSLFAFGLFGLVALNIRNALRTVEERVEIRAFIATRRPSSRRRRAGRCVEVLPRFRTSTP